MRHSTFLSALVLVSSLGAQSPNTGSISSSSSFTSPRIGVIEGPDGASALPILGVAGAARFGDPLSFAGSVTRVFVAPGSGFALVQQNSGVPIAVARLATSVESALPLSPIAGAFAAADRVVFSPTGASAALYSAQIGEWQIIIGLPSNPQAGGRFVLTGISEPIGTAALTDDGEVLIAADQSGELWSVSPGESPIAVYHGTDISALALLPNSRQTVVCDRAANLVVLLSPGSASPRTLLSAAQGLASPAFASATADGSAILIGSPSQAQLWHIDAGNGSATSQPISVAPSALKQLRQGEFLISSPSSPNTWIVDWRGSNSSTFFVAQLKHLASVR